MAAYIARPIVAFINEHIPARTKLLYRLKYSDESSGSFWAEIQRDQAAPIQIFFHDTYLDVCCRPYSNVRYEYANPAFTTDLLRAVKVRLGHVL